MKSTTSSKSRQGMWWAAAILAIAGLGFAIELTLVHAAVGADPFHQSVCNVSATVNCDEVAKSSYAMLLGLPVSIWGMFAYAAALAVSIWGLRTRNIAATAALSLLGTLCALAALSYAAISLFVLKLWCLFCMATWVVDLGLFGLGIALAKSELAEGEGLSVLLIELRDWLLENTRLAFSWGAVGAIALGMAYWTQQHPGADGLSSTARAASPGPAASSEHNLTEGVDAAGLHYVGAKDPKLTIIEYSDYQCPHCARAHEKLRLLVAKYPNAVRVVHRHFPLDNDCNPQITRPFHTRACYYARLATCAALAGKFQRGHDYLFAHGHDDASVPIDTFAREVELEPNALKACLSSKADAPLKRDIEAGIALNIDGTPTFVIGGEKFTGDIPAEVWRNYPL